MPVRRYTYTHSRKIRTRHLFACLALAVTGLSLVGCGQQSAEFEPNLVYFRSQKIAEELEDFQTEPVQDRLADVRRVMAQFFGTPNQPRLPDIEGLDEILELDMLRIAAGSGADAPAGLETGLYRKMCVRCHGIAGSGTGPQAAGLDPYPRDYRRGIFKFKRTPSTLPPTDADLHNVLVRGVPGTAMPSFRLLRELEREALVQYVRYLSIRGQFERAIIEEAAFELNDDEFLLDPDLRTGSNAYQQQWSILQEIALEVAEPWLQAESQAMSAPPRPEDYATRSSIARGRELFFTTLTNCATCHGATALGDGQTDDYDEWTKEIDPTNPEAVSDYVALGSPRPRKCRPRNLHEGIYRGGHEAEDLFLKIKNGIAGTTMPNVAAQLSDEDIWHLVAYARYLPFDPITRPAAVASEELELEQE
jgi:mono/diheme cytochrome c family protein